MGCVSVMFGAALSGSGPEDAPADGDDDSWVSSERVVFWVVKKGGRYGSCAV